MFDPGPARGRAPSFRRLLALLALAPVAVACNSEPNLIEWYNFGWSGGTTNVAVVAPRSPSTGPAPLIVALPWGSGSGPLVQTHLESYWLGEPGFRGYYVISPEVIGTDFNDVANELVPAMMTWAAANFDIDTNSVAIVGASNGGIGAFITAVANPDQFDAILGMPGQYNGTPASLAPIMDIPVLLLVGSLDAEWLGATESTAQALLSQGISVEVDTIQFQNHVLTVNSDAIMDWIDLQLGR